MKKFTLRMSALLEASTDIEIIADTYKEAQEAAWEATRGATDPALWTLCLYSGKVSFDKDSIGGYEPVKVEEAPEAEARPKGGRR